MGLSDLKKKEQTPSQETPAAAARPTLDEFINEAELYAQGQLRGGLMLPDEQEDEDEETAALRAIFKKATYSMSLESIDNLKRIAEEDGRNRSQLLRMFTHYFYQLPPEERDLIYERFNHLFDPPKK